MFSCFKPRTTRSEDVRITSETIILNSEEVTKLRAIVKFMRAYISEFGNSKSFFKQLFREPAENSALTATSSDITNLQDVDVIDAFHWLQNKAGNKAYKRYNRNINLINEVLKYRLRNLNIKLLPYELMASDISQISLNQAATKIKAYIRGKVKSKNLTSSILKLIGEYFAYIDEARPFIQNNSLKSLCILNANNLVLDCNQNESKNDPNALKKSCKEISRICADSCVFSNIIGHGKEFEKIIKSMNKLSLIQSTSKSEISEFAPNSIRVSLSQAKHNSLSSISIESDISRNLPHHAAPMKKRHLKLDENFHIPEGINPNRAAVRGYYISDEDF